MIRTPAPIDGRRYELRALVLGLAGTLAFALGAVADPNRAAAAYLTAFAFWGGLGLGALLLLATFHAVEARWMVVLRRVVEGMAGTLVALPLAFVPVAATLSRLYPWARQPGALLGPGSGALMAEKAIWLTPTGFVLRSYAYMFLWIGTAEALLAYSKSQDRTADPQLLIDQRRLSCGALPLLGISLTYAAFDWLMSLDPSWGSTIFGAYWFAGSFLGALAVVVIACSAMDGGGALRGLVTRFHYFSLGKLVFAFVCFWAYMAFSQLLLIWIVDLPREVPFYGLRANPVWQIVSWALLFGKFAVPFFVLLSAKVKQHRASLTAVAGLLVVMQWVDIQWLVVPPLFPYGPAFELLDFAAVAALGGFLVTLALWRMRGLHAAPALDPFLRASLEYHHS